jgi:hypothetical protein
LYSLSCLLERPNLKMQDMSWLSWWIFIFFKQQVWLSVFMNWKTHSHVSQMAQYLRAMYWDKELLKVLRCLFLTDVQQHKNCIY